MRRLIHRCVLLAAYAALTATAASAQTTLTAGVKGGIDFSALPNAGEVMDQISKVASVDTSSKAGFVVGGYVEFALTEHLAFQPELFFVSKGVKLDLASNGGTMTANVNYLEFPLLARYSKPIDMGTVYAMAGPSFGIKAGTSAHLNSSTQTVDENIDSAVRSFDAGLTFAGGLERGRYLVEVRYTLGLTDTATDTFVHADALKNRVVAILVGFKLK